MLPRFDGASEQDEFILGELDEHFAEFDAAGIHYLCYPGNDDLKVFDKIFGEVCGKYRHVECIAQRKLELAGYEFIGMNWVVDYPFRLKDRCRMDNAHYVFQEQLGSGVLSAPEGWRAIEDWFGYAASLPTIEEELGKLPRPKNLSKAVYVIHMPPSGLGLDRCRSGVEVGSKAVREFLLSSQPLVSFHGHIHESPEMTGRWYAKLGRTLCIQPGQLERLSYVFGDLEAGEFCRVEEDRDGNVRSEDHISGSG